MKTSSLMLLIGEIAVRCCDSPPAIVFRLCLRTRPSPDGDRNGKICSLTLNCQNVLSFATYLKSRTSARACPMERPRIFQLISISQASKFRYPQTVWCRFESGLHFKTTAPTTTNRQSCFSFEARFGVSVACHRKPEKCAYGSAHVPMNALAPYLRKKEMSLHDPGPS